MKASQQNQKHLGESIAFGVVLVMMSVSIVALMMMQSGALR
jgi:hypothetical protein